jgi:site-specific recombinase XerD
MAQDHTTDILPTTVLEAGRAYLRSVNARQKSINTAIVYTLHVNLLTEFLSARGINDIGAIGFADLEAFFDHLRSSHNRGGIHCYFRSIRAWFNWYWDTYEIETRNPIKKIKVPAPTNKAMPGMPIEHFQLIVAACKTGMGLRDKALLYCLLDSCSRATEFVNLNIGDVDFVTGRVTIRSGKGGKQRAVRFGDRSMRALRAYLKQKRGLKLPDRQPLFVTDESERMDRFTLRLLLDRRADDAHVPHYGLHDIRRCGALQLYRNGMMIKDISVYLGHSSVKVTELYLNVTGEDALEKHEVYGAVDNADF